MSEKTEEATPKRLRKAQDDGDSPVSAFASQSLAFLCAVMLAPGAISALKGHTEADLRAAIARAGDATVLIAFDPLPLATAVVRLVTPLLLAAAVAAGVTSLIQSGGVVAARRISPSLDRLSLAAGFRSLFATHRIVAVVRAALFGTAVAWFAFSALRDHAGDVARTTGRLPQAAYVAATIALDVAKRAAFLGIALAVLDIVVTRRSWRKSLKMSKADVQREHDEAHGDPRIKSARARNYQEMLTAATIDDVKSAAVVVEGSMQIACALRYEEPDDGNAGAAPTLVARGRGEQATWIVRTAHAHGVPTISDDPLASALVELDVGASIPEALYEPVATLLRDAWNERDGAVRGPVPNSEP